MPLKHGNKTYFQVLLDPNRAKLVLDKAEEIGLKPTAWVREAIYNELQRIYPANQYNLAKAADDLVWAEAVRKRIESRKNKSE